MSLLGEGVAEGGAFFRSTRSRCRCRNQLTEKVLNFLFFYFCSLRNHKFQFIQINADIKSARESCNCCAQSRHSQAKRHKSERHTKRERVYGGGVGVGGRQQLASSFATFFVDKLLTHQKATTFASFNPLFAASIPCSPSLSSFAQKRY